MNDTVLPPSPALIAGVPPWHEAAGVGVRIAQRLRAEGGERAGAGWGPVLELLEKPWRRAHEPSASAAAAGRGPAGALDDLAATLGLSDEERTLLLLAAMPDVHESFGAAFAAMHPRGESRPSWGLFCWLVAADTDRAATYARLQDSPLLRLGLVRLGGDAPLPERSLDLASGLWSALHGLPAWPAGVAALQPVAGGEALDDWLTQPPASDALEGLRGPGPLWLQLRADSPGTLRLRACQLAAALGAPVLAWSAELDAAALSSLLGQCLALQVLPVLLPAAPLDAAALVRLEACPGPVLLAGGGALPASTSRPLMVLEAPPLSAAAQRRLWQRWLPELAPHGELLATRHALGPQALQQLRLDLAPWLARGRLPPLERCVAALQARTAQGGEPFAQRVRPRAGWDDLVLPPARLALLRQAVQRMQLQQQVLEDWGFGQRPHPGRGLRMLFSGLPGTGKTLAAEVMAHALHAELLVIDLARLVSKWIGETEKNLAAAFDQAEGGGAVLFFDEADALFGKRTEVADAHDRYANIESAYLLARLERFDGVAILATNLRSHLDKAFLRRFEVVLEFTEPGPVERAAIWRAQFPSGAPLAAGLGWDELAALHPLPGALIRNAALGAAFLAAAEGQPIGRAHIELALQQEYGKAGRVGPN